MYSQLMWFWLRKITSTGGRREDGWGKKGGRKGRRVEEEEKEGERGREGERKGRARERGGKRRVKGGRRGRGSYSRCYHWHTYLEVVEVQCTVKGEDANHSPGISW